MMDDAKKGSERQEIFSRTEGPKNLTNRCESMLIVLDDDEDAFRILEMLWDEYNHRICILKEGTNTQTVQMININKMKVIKIGKKKF